MDIAVGRTHTVTCRDGPGLDRLVAHFKPLWDLQEIEPTKSMPAQHLKWRLAIADQKREYAADALIRIGLEQPDKFGAALALFDSRYPPNPTAAPESPPPR